MVIDVSPSNCGLARTYVLEMGSLKYHSSPIAHGNKILVICTIGDDGYKLAAM